MSRDTERKIKAECREWLALLHSGDASDADRARFEAWLKPIRDINGSTTDCNCSGRIFRA